MKKISLYAASLIALGLGLTACDQLHNDLRLEVPTSYTLETPSGTDQLIIFGATGSNVNNELKVVTYNPYNVNTTVDFQVQVAKSESDFQTWDNLMSQAVGNGETDYDFTDVDGLPYATFVSGIYTTPSFTVPGADFSDAINAVYGYETAEEATAQPVEVAYRVYAWVPGVEYSFIFSNIVVLNEVQSYLPLREPRQLYVVGEPQGWDIKSDSMYLTETEPGSNIYKGSITVAAGQFMFRFYTELGDWEYNSIGAGPEDDGNFDIIPTNDTFTGEVYYDPSVEKYGKVNWNYPEWEGGKVDLEVDLNSNTITMTLHPGASDIPAPTGNALYLIGTPQGWNINASDLYLSETSEGSGIYKGTFNIPAPDELTDGVCTFRFYSALGDWETNSYGAQVEDNAVDISLENSVYFGDVVVGKGSWHITNWEGGYLQIEVNLNDKTIQMTQVDEPEGPDIYIIGDLFGGSWDINDSSHPLSLKDGVYTATYEVPAFTGDKYFRFYTELGDWASDGELPSVGPLPNDNTNEPVVFSNGEFKGTCVAGKGSWLMSNYSGGKIRFIVDLENWTVTFEEVN